MINKEYDFMGYKTETVERAVEDYGKGNIYEAIFNMEAKIASLQVEADSLRDMVVGEWKELRDIIKMYGLDKNLDDEEE